MFKSPNTSEQTQFTENTNQHIIIRRAILLVISTCVSRTNLTSAQSFQSAASWPRAAVITVLYKVPWDHDQCFLSEFVFYIILCVLYHTVCLISEFFISHRMFYIILCVWLHIKCLTVIWLFESILWVSYHCSLLWYEFDFIMYVWNHIVCDR